MFNQFLSVVNKTSLFNRVQTLQISEETFLAKFIKDNTDPPIYTTVNGDINKLQVSSSDKYSTFISQLAIFIAEQRSIRPPLIIPTKSLSLKSSLRNYKWLIKCMPTLAFEEIEGQLYEFLNLSPMPLSKTLTLFNPFPNHKDRLFSHGYHFNSYVMSHNPYDEKLRLLNLKLYYLIRSLLPNLVKPDFWSENDRTKTQAYFKVSVLISLSGIKLLKVQQRSRIHQNTFLFGKNIAVTHNKEVPNTEQLSFRAFSINSLASQENGYYSANINIFHSVGRKLSSFNAFINQQVSDLLIEADLPSDYITTYRYYLPNNNYLATTKDLFKYTSLVNLQQVWFND